MASMHAGRIQIGMLLLALAIGSGRTVTADDQVPLGPRVVLIIRHAEKPANTGPEKDPNLTERGYQRAEALVKAIPANFPKPDFVIATKRSTNSNRPVETVTPLAKALNEYLDDAYAEDEVDRLAHALLTDPKYAGKVVLIAWHHGKIPDLAKALGAKEAAAQWDPTVFDRVWEITCDANGAVWKDLPQKALPGDTEK